MAHKDWCGKPCSECQNPCKLDYSLPCSPDCENLGQDGYPIEADCKGCDAYEEYRIMMEDEENSNDNYPEPSDAEQACHLIEEITEIVDGLEIDKKVKVKIKDKLYEITTHLDM